jgi:hypothetical protein
MFDHWEGIIQEGLTLILPGEVLNGLGGRGRPGQKINVITPSLLFVMNQS